MSKTWYPMINYERCIECGLCTDNCTHSVYNQDKAPKPLVVYPEGCVQGCRGCQSICPSSAIEYFGDTGEPATDNVACCDGGCSGSCGGNDNNSKSCGDCNCGC